ncbi:MAG: hypothetical protein OK449_01245 [Thaumarchaeota archaeon]|nr:hypothetical protein [Nitrososphaerota archaeon]
MSEDDWKAQLRRYVAEHGDSLEFTGHFWRGCEPLAKDVIQYAKFAWTLGLIQDGIKASHLAPKLGINDNSTSKWKNLEQMPKLGHFLKAFLIHGAPAQGRVWLTLEHSHGYAIPIGQFIQVPTTIRTWEDVAPVLSQIQPLVIPAQKFSRPYLFGFLIGIVIGDAHKPKQGHGHRHIELVMSEKYETNVKIGEFTSLCANQLGLRMSRGKDLPKPRDKPHGFHLWRSQSSPLIDWIFHVGIGLEDGQHTTYDTIHADWVLDAPEDFRLGLIQGIAESDGSVNIAGQEVEFWVLPDWDFMIRLLATFGLRGFRNREAVSLSKSQAIASFRIPVFASHLRTVRYQKLELMSTTQKLAKEERLPDQIRAEIGRLDAIGHSVPEIVEEIARNQHLLVSFEAAQRWALKSRNRALKVKEEAAIKPKTLE